MQIVNLKDLHPNQTQVIDLKVGDSFEYQRRRYEVTKQWSGRGGVICKDILTSKGVKFTPFTFINNDKVTIK